MAPLKRLSDVFSGGIRLSCAQMTRFQCAQMTRFFVILGYIRQFNLRLSPTFFGVFRYFQCILQESWNINLWIHWLVFHAPFLSVEQLSRCRIVWPAESKVAGSLDACCVSMRETRFENSGGDDGLAEIIPWAQHQWYMEYPRPNMDGFTFRSGGNLEGHDFSVPAIWRTKAMLSDHFFPGQAQSLMKRAQQFVRGIKNMRLGHFLENCWNMS